MRRLQQDAPFDKARRVSRLNSEIGDRFGDYISRGLLPRREFSATHICSEAAPYGDNALATWLQQKRLCYSLDARFRICTTKMSQ